MINKFSNIDLGKYSIKYSINSNTRRTMQIFMYSSEISTITDD